MIELIIRLIEICLNSPSYCPGACQKGISSWMAKKPEL